MRKEAYNRMLERVRALVDENHRLRQSLTDCLKEIEDDAVAIDGEWGPCRSLEELIAQDAMPQSWKNGKAVLTTASAARQEGRP